MPSRAYPLEAAVLDRQGKRAHSEGQLAAALRAQARLEVAAVEAQRALEAHLALRPSLGAQGRLAARELKRSAAFARRHDREAVRLRAAHEAAVARLDAARTEVTAARAALGQAYVAEQALARDKERFVSAERAQARAAEQEELDEQHASRRPRPR